MSTCELLPRQNGLWLAEVVLPEFAVRGAVICGEHTLLIWDTLSQPADMAPVVELVERSEHRGKRVIVVYSHADWDHVWGTAALTAFNPLIVGHISCLARFADEAPQTLETMRRESPGRWDAVELIAPTLIFEQSMMFDLGGITLELHTLPGHTSDCLIAFVPAWNLLLAGDTVETPIPYLTAESDLPAWISGLEALHKGERIMEVIPSHGPIGDRGLIGSTLDYLHHAQKGVEPTLPPHLSTADKTLHAANMRLASANIEIRPIREFDRRWMVRFLTERWGSAEAIVRGKRYDVAAMEGFVAVRERKVLGLITYHFEDGHGEVMTLDSLLPGRGIARRLLDATVGAIRDAGIHELRVVTTNDNHRALRLYQRYGFVIREVRVNALAATRRLKPQIPLIGLGDIPLRDEIELALNTDA